jgi:uncharacterized membrane protein YqaE (UPF0057 family)
MIIIAILFPALSLLIRGKVFSAIFCLIAQITMVGWIPAAIYAVYNLSQDRNKKRMEEMENRILASQRQKI